MPVKQPSSSNNPSRRTKAGRDSGYAPAWPIPKRPEDVPPTWKKQHQIIALHGLFRRMQLAEKYDEKTGALTEGTLQNIIAADQLRNRGKPRGLMFFDLGNFKRVNALLGQDGGDDVLIRMTGLFARLSDTVARVGGDEFAVYMDITPRDGKRTPEEVLAEQLERVAAMRNEIIEDYPVLDQGPIRFFVSAGAVVYDHESGYAAMRRIANIAADANKSELHELYGEYRTAD